MYVIGPDIIFAIECDDFVFLFRVNPVQCACELVYCEIGWLRKGRGGVRGREREGGRETEREREGGRQRER